MIRRFRFSILVALAIIFSSALAMAATDKGYPKAENKKSWGEIFSWVFGGEPFGKSYALVVGISEYSGQGFSRLEETGGDPERMRQFLLNDAGFDFVHVLTDEAVNPSRLRKLILDEFRGLVGPSDRFVLYWSGHGIPVSNFAEQQLGYLPLAMSDLSSLASMLSMDEVLSWTELIGAKQVLHILDTCFSGLARLPETQAADAQVRTVELLAKPARHLLTATTGGGKTIAAREWNGSIFTDAFIEGARGSADKSGDGVVDMLELEGFIRTKVNDRRSLIKWPSVIRPKSYDLQNNEGEFFFISAAKKRELAKVDEKVAFEAGMPVVSIGPSANTLANVACDADADHLFWETIKDKSETAYFKAYLKRANSGDLCGRFASLAKIELGKLQTEPAIKSRSEQLKAPLPRERIVQIQEMLTELGFGSSIADGDLGPRTRAAIIEFQRSISVAATGRMTDDDEIALAHAYADHRARTRLTGSRRSNPDDSLDGPILTDWSPQKPVEFVVMGGLGGSADQIARLFRSLIQKNSLSPQPFILINKPGGSGADALAYLNGKAGDDHTILMTVNGFYTAPIILDSLGVDILSFTPIARMALDTFPAPPKAKELGYDIEYYRQRSINGPPGMSVDAQAWYINLFRSVYEANEWRRFCLRNGLFCDEWMAGDDLANFHAEQLQITQKIIDQIGAEAIAAE